MRGCGRKGSDARPTPSPPASGGDVEPAAYAAKHAVGRIEPSSRIPEDGLKLIVVGVGTRIDDTGSTNVSQVVRALDEAAPTIAAGAACVIRSTMPVGSAARLADRSGIAPEDET